MAKMEEFDLHDPKELASFIKTTIEEALAEHSDTMSEAGLLGQYPAVAQKYGDDPGFADKLEQAFQLVGKNEGMKLLDAYEQLDRGKRQSSRTAGNSMDRLGKPDVRPSGRRII